MRDALIFAIGPYVAAAIAAVGLVMQARRQTPESIAPRARSGGPARIAWRFALGLVAAVHILSLVFPETVLAWNREFVRLLVLEGIAAAAAAIALGGTVAALLRLVLDGRRSAQSRIDLVALSIVLVAISSGLGLAGAYRWASSWAGVTIVPYLHSLRQLQPSIGLVTHLPVLVKLHLASAFVAVGVAPFTSPGRAAVGKLTSTAAVIVTPGIRVVRPAWRAAERWITAQMGTAATALFGDRGEEN